MELVAAYRRHIFDLMVGLCSIGVAAQGLAAAMTGASLPVTLGIMSTCSSCLILIVLAQKRFPSTLFVGLLIGAGFSTGEGLFYLNGGWDGSHLYPLLWGFSIVSFVGLYGEWPLTILAMLAGCAVNVLGKLFWPELTFGVNTDVSWARVASQCSWWLIALSGAGITGQRVIRLAKTASGAQSAVLAAQAKEHAWTAEAERLRLAAATERADALTELARAFDGQVRTMVAAVAETSVGIGARASVVSHSASATGERVRRAASLSEAVAQDTTVVTQNAAELGGSLIQVRGQAQGASAAAVAATHQIERSNAAILDLVDATSRVGKAISLVGVIADRTNLLALNATIEAARAGEAGRGFAVVASEVKLLARRTTGAAEEISALVRDMRQAGEHAASALQSIGHSIGEVSQFAAQVSDAAEHQATAIGAITRTVASLNDKTAEVRLQVSDVATAADATSEAAGAMLDAAAALGRDAGSLQTEAGAFIASVRAA